LSQEDCEGDLGKYNNANVNAKTGEDRDRKPEGTWDANANTNVNTNMNGNANASGAHLDSADNHGGGALARVDKDDKAREMASESICEVDEIDGGSPQHGRSTRYAR
jgi:hypothetical protein